MLLFSLIQTVIMHVYVGYIWRKVQEKLTKIGLNICHTIYQGRLTE